MLHWLPVPQQIQFKIAISAFDCVRQHRPVYFSNICIPLTGISGRANLRSAERHDMLVPSTRTQLGRRSFHVAAPTVWNALPPHLRSSSINRGQFRAELKTHLFTQAYGHLWELLLKSVLFYIYTTTLQATISRSSLSFTTACQTQQHVSNKSRLPLLQRTLTDTCLLS